ncbi:Exosome complex component CSL4 [Corchorus capsularis]|uniref:Exosome complex component CSL4 n=1 Tax=Corchorus capsularis TaxID=210143 RepID=A0A1R3IPS0_COCAP|nr:Exosome complex component CSL4 [Corchorus capsularis]
MEEAEMVTPGEVLGRATELKAGKGAYVAPDNKTIYASLTGFRRIQSPPSDSPDKRPTVEVTGHKAHGPVPEPGSVVIARVTKVMARTASADIMCVGPKSVREKFTGVIRQQDVRATEIDKVDMHLSFRPGDIVRAVVLSLGDARAYYLSTAENELGVVSAESSAVQESLSLFYLVVYYRCSNGSNKLDGNAVPIDWANRAKEESDSPKSLEPDPQSLLQEVADSFDLPSDYFSQLPGDLRLDLNDAAFDLSNGPVIDQCGLALGETLLNLSRAWELADTSTSHKLASKLPMLGSSLTGSGKSAFGKRLLAAGRRFQAMGQYGQGELQKIAKAMTAAGKLLSASSVSTTTDEQPKTETRMFKFGELQVEVSSEKANIGAAIGFVFGILSWQIAQGIQSIPESSLEYANDNALLLAKSLRGALLAIFYSSTLLSAFTTIGLVLLGRQLKSEGKQLQSAASIIKNDMNDIDVRLPPVCANGLSSRNRVVSQLSQLKMVEQDLQIARRMDPFAGTLKLSLTSSLVTASQGCLQPVLIVYSAHYN